MWFAWLFTTLSFNIGDPQNNIENVLVK
jgi:hypothetical protein